MSAKSITFLVLALTLAVVGFREQRAGGFSGLSAEFRAWLLANSKNAAAEGASPAAADADSAPSRIILARLDDEEKISFEDWPLTRLDYAIVLKNLARYRPRVVALVPALSWPAADEFSTGILRGQVENGPAIVLGYRLAESGGGSADFLPGYEGGAPAALQALAFQGLALGPEPSLAAAASQLGFTHPAFIPAGPGAPDRVPLLAREGDRLMPSLILAGAARALAASSASVFAGINTDAFGAIELLDKGADLVRFDAASLVLAGQDEAGIALEQSELDAIALLEDSIVVIGDDSAPARVHQLSSGRVVSTAELVALGISSLFSSAPRLAEWPLWTQLLLWLTLIALGVKLMSQGRRRIVIVAFAALVLYFAGSLVVFQSTRTWASPAVPLGLLALTVLVGAVFPVPKRKENANAPA